MLLNRPWKPWPYRNLEPAFPIQSLSLLNLSCIVDMIWYRSRNTSYTLPSPRCQSAQGTQLPITCHAALRKIAGAWHLDTRFLVPGTKYQQDIWETETIFVPAPACIWVQMSKSSALMTKPRPVELKSKKFKFGFNITLWPPRHQYFVTADILENGMANLIDQYSSALI